MHVIKSIIFQVCNLATELPITYVLTLNLKCIKSSAYDKDRNYPDIHFCCKLHKISIDNVEKVSLAKFDLARHMLNLAGKCLVTDHYHKPCRYH